MLLYKQGLYVVGRRLARPDDGRAILPGDVAVFAVERFTDAEFLRATPFTPPSDFQLSTIMHGAFGLHLGDPTATQDVVIELSKAKAPLVRARLRHPAQRLDDLPDGRVRLTFPCANLAPVVSWVLEWGPHARALAPPALIDDVRSELVAALQQYPEPNECSRPP